MDNKIHLKNPVSGNTFCGIAGHKIYTKKGMELVGLKRLTEVNCLGCLLRAPRYYCLKKLEAADLHDKVEEQLSVVYPKEISHSQQNQE
jgi:hypothetical protein